MTTPLPRLWTGTRRISGLGKMSLKMSSPNSPSLAVTILVVEMFTTAGRAVRYACTTGLMRLSRSTWPAATTDVVASTQIPIRIR